MYLPFHAEPSSTTIPRSLSHALCSVYRPSSVIQRDGPDPLNCYAITGDGSPRDAQPMNSDHDTQGQGRAARGLGFAGRLFLENAVAIEQALLIASLRVTHARWFQGANPEGRHASPLLLGK